MPVVIPAPQQQQSQFPAFMLTAVADYKKLASEYPNITDPTLKEAYKAVLDKKLGDLQAMLTQYNTTVTSAISALQVV